MKRPTLSLVIPVFNEEAVIPELRKQLGPFLDKLDTSVEVIFVDDGSHDASLSLLRDLCKDDRRFGVIALSRNFGHQGAITAGTDHARGDAVVVMDADLQDPLDVIVAMIELWREGFDVVYAKRRSRKGETWFKILTAKLFYRLLRKMMPIEVPLDTGDFRLMSRRVVLAMRALRETHRFVRGMVAWVGFKQTAVLYDRQSRFAGETKYPLTRMVRFAIDGITSFSVLPLRFSTILGVTISLFSVGYATYAVIAHYILKVTVPGWTATVVLVALVAAVQLLMIGILGEYVGRIYEEVKRRPLYIVGERTNVTRDTDDDEAEADGAKLDS